MIDPNIVRKIVELAEVMSGDEVLEIGPGPGALTQLLLEKGARVYAVEMDSVFAKELARFQNGNLSVFEDDILRFSLERLPKHLKIVANLPYHITTPILEKIFQGTFSTLTIMVQKEVAQRMAAEAGTKEYGSLSLFVKYYSHYFRSFIVPAPCFYPQPKVDSTVIRLDARTPPQVNKAHFFHLVHKSFQQRRKMLTTSLGLPKDRLRATLERLGARADARPETLSLDQWVQLAEEMGEFLFEGKE